MSPDPYADAEAFGDPRDRQEPSRRVARRLSNCPQCDGPLRTDHPSLTCRHCGYPLDDSAPPVRRKDV